MADKRKALTAELLQLTEQQLKALQDVTFLGWEPGRLTPIRSAANGSHGYVNN
jgi:hypothetical protein